MPRPFPPGSKPILDRERARPTDGQGPSDRQAPQVGAEHPQDHPDDGADRHRAVQEGARPRDRRRRRTPARSPSWSPTSARSSAEVSHPLLEVRETGQTLALAGPDQQPRAWPAATTATSSGSRPGPVRTPRPRDRPVVLEVAGKRGINFCRFRGIADRRELHPVRGPAAVRRGRGAGQQVHRHVRPGRDRPGRRRLHAVHQRRAARGGRPRRSCR